MKRRGQIGGVKTIAHPLYELLLMKKEILLKVKDDVILLREYIEVII